VDLDVLLQVPLEISMRGVCGTFAEIGDDRRHLAPASAQVGAALGLLDQEIFIEGSDFSRGHLRLCDSRHEEASEGGKQDGSRRRTSRRAGGNGKNHDGSFWHFFLWEAQLKSNRGT
jgi:hypothetical protein